MNQVEIYTKSYCPFCARAKELLSIKGVPFTEIDITDDLRGEQEMRQRSGQTTVPAIFIDGVPIGGCNELFVLDERGELDSRLGLKRPCE